MKVTSEFDLDLDHFEAWSGGKVVLDILIEKGGCDDVQTFIEECFPDGIDETALNDYLWFQVEEDFPQFFEEDEEDEED